MWCIDVVTSTYSVCVHMRYVRVRTCVLRMHRERFSKHYCLPLPQTIVCHLHGVEALLRCISNGAGQDKIVEPAVCALRHVTSRHPNAEMAQAIVRSQNGVPLLLNLMQQQARWPVVLVGCGYLVLVGDWGGRGVVLVGYGPIAHTLC